LKYFYLKEQREKLKEKKEKIKEKREKNNENYFEQASDDEKRRSEFKKKLDSYELKKRQVSERRISQIKEIIKRENQKYEKILENKKKFEAEKTSYYDNILKYQSSVITRSDLKESSCELSKISAW
jgi:hypothetical protein